MDVKKLRILIVDDHRLVSEGIQRVLSEQYDPLLIDVASSVAEALSYFDSAASYDLLLTDIYLPTSDGFELMTILRDRKIVVPTIAISSTEKMSDIDRAIDLGASGFISKSMDGENMLLAIEEVMIGNIFLSEDVLMSMKMVEQKVVPAQSNRDSDGDVEINIKLTKRQLETLKLLEQGFTNKEIAGILCVSESTIKTHIKALFAHLAVGTRTACVREARQKNLLH